MAGARLRGSRIGEANQAAQNIANLFEKAKATEKLRRDRQSLDNIATAISSGATSIQEIQAAANQPPTFDTGIGGFMQRFAGGSIQPGGGPGEAIQSSIVGDALKRALSGLSPEQQTQAAEIKAGIKPRASAALRQVEGFEATKEEKAIDRDTAKLKKLIDDGKAENSPQAERIRIRLRNNPAAQEIQPGNDYTDFLKDETKKRVGIFDKAFGKEAYRKGLRKAKDAALSEGFTEQSVEADFNRWWDEQAASEDPKGFGELVVPRSEFQKDVKGVEMQLDTGTAQALLQEAGGDKDKARQLAKERGFKF